uniref:Uncharacterized protein n=1 Tax=Anguilla anguilla TaxID=7936 RepID=A0A0E9RYD9_ANGAN
MRPFRPIESSCLLTVEGLTETPVDFIRSEARVELAFFNTSQVLSSTVLVIVIVSVAYQF